MYHLSLGYLLLCTFFFAPWFTPTMLYFRAWHKLYALIVTVQFYSLFFFCTLLDRKFSIYTVNLCHLTSMFVFFIPMLRLNNLVFNTSVNMFCLTLFLPEVWSFISLRNQLTFCTLFNVNVRFFIMILV